MRTESLRLFRKWRAVSLWFGNCTNHASLHVQNTYCQSWSLLCWYTLLFHRLSALVHELIFLDLNMLLHRFHPPSSLFRIMGVFLRRHKCSFMNCLHDSKSLIRWPFLSELICRNPHQQCGQLLNLQPIFQLCLVSVLHIFIFFLPSLAQAFIYWQGHFLRHLLRDLLSSFRWFFLIIQNFLQI